MRPMTGRPNTRHSRKEFFHLEETSGGPLIFWTSSAQMRASPITRAAGGSPLPWSPEDYPGPRRTTLNPLAQCPPPPAECELQAQSGSQPHSSRRICSCAPRAALETHVGAFLGDFGENMVALLQRRVAVVFFLLFCATCESREGKSPQWRQMEASSHTAIRMLLSRLKLVCRMAEQTMAFSQDCSETRGRGGEG
ncbi:hypothetical protein EYF80_040494 [Liparis tanakae]|uniref:Uncharacterized protein n=1 Tax=Liparis tanakae TaxID=230148 RepID=A0A4Z2G728_9TELE|nr:hypothetical protein EYF80_040494 [Liparis tanakae]